MNLSVWKFVWPTNMPDVADIEMPLGAEVLHVSPQMVDFSERLVMWARVDTEAVKVRYRFALCGTGHAAPADHHVGTALMHGGNFVLHVFQRGNA
jgi:hypothetical protein